MTPKVSRSNPASLQICKSKCLNLNVARSERVDLLAPHVQILWSADGLELAASDEIKHLARIDANRGPASGQRMSFVVSAT
jgi:hypothetical protein